jgi:hypothetical protein
MKCVLYDFLSCRNFIISVLFQKVKKKRWSDPVTLHGGAWGERRYSFYSFSTSTLDGGEWSASRPSRALPPVPIIQEAEWAPEPVWTQRLEEKFSASFGDRTPVVQSVVRHYTDWASLHKQCKQSLEVFTLKSVRSNLRRGILGHLSS